MDNNLISQASHRISGEKGSSERVSNPSTHPGQNGGFSDGFDHGSVVGGGLTPALPPVLTKSPVDACHSGQPGKSSDPENPMKLKDTPTSEGSPAHPPFADSQPMLHERDRRLLDKMVFGVAADHDFKALRIMVK
jgi:hypothetical protein